MSIDPRIPAICDYDCPFASFPPAETAGICRTMSAVLCGKLAILVNKNGPCEFRKRAGAKSKSIAKKSPKRARSRRQ